MPTARLPDINTAIITHRGDMLEAKRHDDYTGTVQAYMAINALMPSDADKTTGRPKYRVQFSNKAYGEANSGTMLAVCPACKIEFKRSELKVYLGHPTPLERIIAGEPRARFWKCTKCKAVNRLAKTRHIHDRVSAPNFFGVVPPPPIRPIGLAGRTWYREKFHAWAAIAIPELENKIAQYRDDYWVRDSLDAPMDAGPPLEAAT